MNKTRYVTKSSLPPIEEYINEIKGLWESSILTNMGELHKKLKKELIDYLKVNEISLFVNGHLALELAIQALGITGEVITTPFTFISTTHAIVRRNLTPVFCDINEEDYTLDVSKIESLITEKTSAILPVHVYGNICNVEEIERIAKKYNLKVIYDAAHAFGCEYNGQGIGSFGDASMFSFHATKVFHTIEGGAVVYNTSEIGKLLYQLKNFGIKSQEEVDGIGLNAKMNEFQAAMGICNLRHIEDEIDKRRQVTEWYDKRLKGINGIKIRNVQENVKYNYSYYPIRAIEEELGYSRDDIFEWLKNHQIYARKYFYPLTYQAECYSGIFNTVNTPVADRISKQILVLPLATDMTEEEVDKITNIIRSIKR